MLYNEMMNIIRSWINRIKFNWAYLHEPPWDSGKSPPELILFLQQHPPGTALDLGCGTGTNVIFMAQRGWTVDGIDFSGLAIRQARRQVKKARVDANLIKGDVTRLQDYALRAPYDLALDIGCLHALGTLESARAYAAGLTPAIRPGGYFLLYAHCPAQEPGNFPAHGLTPAWAEQLFSDSLSMVEFQPGKEKNRDSAWYFFRKPAG